MKLKFFLNINLVVPVHDLTTFTSKVSRLETMKYLILKTYTYYLYTFIINYKIVYKKCLVLLNFQEDLLFLLPIHFRMK